MIKSEITKNEVIKPGFPKLMISDFGSVVLFSARGIGMVVMPHGGSFGTSIGLYSNDWDMSLFSDCDHVITLSNEV